MITQNFKQQVELLLEILSDVVYEHDIALKGGTAINLFVQNLPRMSIDIDLAYIKISDRNSFLMRNSEIASKICEKLQNKGLSVIPNKTSEGFTNQIRVENKNTIVKIDINLVIRGSVYQGSLKVVNINIKKFL